MKMSVYQVSPYLRTVSDPRTQTAMVYHALYGNPRVFNDEGLKFLELFRSPTSIEEARSLCDDDPKELIDELIEIFFLVEPGFNEKEFLRKRKTEHLSRVSSGQTIDRMGLAISDACNFGCTHCIHFQPTNGKVLPIYGGSVAQLKMSWETAKRCVDHYVELMRKQGKNNCKIHFGNAEPLINWPVIEKILQYCDGMSDLSFDFAINTNLVLLNREIAESLKKHGVRIATSLDGTEEANNAIRITKGGRGTFDSILKKFDLLAEIGYPLDGFSITVTRGNFDIVDTDIIDLATERKMTSLAFDYDLIGLIDVPVAVRVEKLMKLKQRANEYEMDFFGTWDTPFRNIMSESLLSGNHAFCAAVEGRALEFNIDGSIKVCSHTTTKVGNVDNFDAMFQEGGGLFKMVQERFPGTDEYCSGCAIEGPCGGQCHVTREVVGRSVPGDRQRFFEDMCNFYRSVTEALIVEYLQSGGLKTIQHEPICAL